MESYYIKTEMAGTGHVYTKRITTVQRVEEKLMSTNHPGTLEGVGKVTYVYPGSPWENFVCAKPAEDQRASRGPKLFLIPHEELVAAVPSAVES